MCKSTGHGAFITNHRLLLLRIVKEKLQFFQILSQKYYFRYFLYIKKYLRKRKRERLWSMAEEEMVAGDVTGPPRKVLIISAGASHSVALLSMSLTLFVGYKSLYVVHGFSWSELSQTLDRLMDKEEAKDVIVSCFDYCSWGHCLLLGQRRGWTVRSWRCRG